MQGAWKSPLSPNDKQNAKRTEKSITLLNFVWKVRSLPVKLGRPTGESHYLSEQKVFSWSVSGIKGEAENPELGLMNCWRVREGNGTPLQYSCLENPRSGRAWWAAVHGVAKSQTRLSDFTFPFHFHALEKEMATHSSVLAWRISLVGCHLWGCTELDTTEGA